MLTMEKINVHGTSHVIEACRSCGVRRLVHFSTIHALNSSPEDKTIDEERFLVGPGDGLAYDRTKAQAERVVMMAAEEGLDAVIVSPTALVGPLDFRPSKIGKAMLRMCHKRRAFIVAGGFNWVDVRDVVSGALAAEQRGRRGERYILSGTWLSLSDLFNEVKKASGLDIRTVTSPIWLARLASPFATIVSRAGKQDPLYTKDTLYTICHHRFVSCDKARQELGYRTRPISETISDTITWFRDSGYLKNTEGDS